MSQMKSTLLGACAAAVIGIGQVGLSAGAITLITAEVAHAEKGGGGGGGDRGGDRGNSGDKGNKGGNSGDKGNKGGNGKSSASKNPFSFLFGKKTQPAAPAAKPVKAAPKPVKAAPGQAKKSELAANESSASKGNGKAHGKPGALVAGNPTVFHPRDLGNMNGALNANINAVLAHVRNGNTNGPVGHLAALAVADANAAAAETYLTSPAVAEYVALNDLIAVETAGAYTDLASYLAAVDAQAITADPEVEAALAGLGQAALDQAIADNPTYSTLEEYQTALAGDASVLDPNIEAALANLGMVDEDILAGMTDAYADIEAVGVAESEILSYWNKNGDTDPEVTTEIEADLLDKLRERYADYSDEIAEAMPAEEAEVVTPTGDEVLLVSQ